MQVSDLEMMSETSEWNCDTKSNDRANSVTSAQYIEWLSHTIHEEIENHSIRKEINTINLPRVVRFI